MLELLHLKHVGPAPEMEMHLAPRLNLITGDNGLGKTFLMEIAWWALTKGWSSIPVSPQKNKNNDAHIRYFGHMGELSIDEKCEFKDNKWVRIHNLAYICPSIILYFKMNSSFVIWDVDRNLHDINSLSFSFSSDSVWNGLREQEKVFCNGLISDWAGWQKEKGEAFDLLCKVLKVLSPSEDEILVPGKLTRVSIDDVRDMPTIQMPYGQEVPVVHASAGMQRILMFAYLLVWTWQEHLHAAELLGKEPVKDIVFLIDEVEAHLHPQWQRKIFAALFEVVNALTEREMNVQIIASTHSPLILSSLEPLFDTDKDKLFTLDLEKEEGQDTPIVKLSELPWKKHGEADNWLMSEAFDLHSSRAREIEELLDEASALLAQEDPSTESILAMEANLGKMLSDTDSFWIRWRYIVEKKKGLLK
jgi:AAA domain, putative AbiEii toxin, Type IV TA system